MYVPQRKEFNVINFFSINTYVCLLQIGVRDNDDFSRPRKLIEKMLRHIKAAGCDVYVILIANGLLSSQFLQYAEGYII